MTNALFPARAIVAHLVKYVGCTAASLDADSQEAGVTQVSAAGVEVSMLRAWMSVSIRSPTAS